MKNKKIISLSVAIVMILSMMTFSAGADTDTGGAATPPSEPLFESRISAADEIVITATVKSGPTPATITSSPAINLTRETFDTDGIEIKSFSVNGTTWRNTKGTGAGAKDTFSPSGFAKLLNREMTLHVANTTVDKSTKEPANLEENVPATIWVFPKSEKRPKIDKVAVNYLAFADNTGETAGEWTLLSKEDAERSAVRPSLPGGGFGPSPIQTAAIAQMAKLEIMIPTGVKSRQGPNDVWGVANYGSIPVRPLSLASRTATTTTTVTATMNMKAIERRDVYLIRQAPFVTEAANGDITGFTPASRARRINSVPEARGLKVPSVRFPKDNAVAPNNRITIPLRAGQTIITLATGSAIEAIPLFDGTLTQITTKPDAPRPVERGDTIVLFTRATARRPASHPIQFTIPSTGNARPTTWTSARPVEAPIEVPTDDPDDPDPDDPDGTDD
jgi:hypothetical protein